MEDDFWRSLLFFFSGVFSYRLLSAFLNYSHLYGLFYEIIKNSLEILKLVDDSISSTNNYRYEMLKETDISKEEFEKIKKADRTIILTWREMVITALLKTSPKHFRLSSKFTTWNQSMNYRDKLYK